MPGSRTPSRASVQAWLAARSLRHFYRAAWPVIEPSTALRSNWHIDAIVEHLEAVTAGEIRRLVINIPPRCMKSSLVSVLWPAWAWILRPELRWLFASYAERLSIRDSVRCRRVIQSMGGRKEGGSIIERVGYQGVLELVGQRWALTGDQNEKLRFENDATGYRLATSVGGSATGEGGDILVIDDPHKADEAESDVQRQNVLDWMDGTMSTRLNDPATGAVVLIMQRLHEGDLTGHLLARGDYEHLCLPMEYEPSHPFVWPRDPRGGAMHTVVSAIPSARHENGNSPAPPIGEGALLWPEHFPAAQVASLKTSLGAYRAAGQLQQRPAPMAGGMFKAAHIRRWTGEYHGGGRGILTLQTDHGPFPLDLAYTTRVMTVDVAASIKELADYTAATVWAIDPHRRAVLLDIENVRVEGPDQPALIQRLRRAHDVQIIGVENKTFGLNLIQSLMRMGEPVRPLKADIDKMSRAIPATVLYENGRVFHPSHHPKLVELEGQMLAFPNAVHDDLVDTVAHLGLWLDQIPAGGAARGHELPAPVSSALVAGDH
jgi:predicted phage terminase large subunit-like protein